MKIYQIVTNLSIGDAIGNDILAIDETLSEAGYHSRIMSSTIHEQLTGRASDVDFSRIQPEDLVIFHKATGDSFGGFAAQLPCTRGMIYHNITPAKFFLPYDDVMAWNLWRGRRQLRKLAKIMDFAWGDSSYNCRELELAGFPREKLAVLPILFGKDDGQVGPDPETLRRLTAQRGTRLLFIGRIAPNKKQEDIIKLYYCFLRDVDPDAKLYIVGNWSGFEKYYAKLKGFAADLRLRDDQVVFAGHVTEAEKSAYLACADAFVCMSEHEGFCIPLLEAMRRDVPVIAYASSAVPETLGENGLLFQKKDYVEMARQTGRACRDEAFRQRVLQSQRENLKRFDRETTRTKLLGLVRQAVECKGAVR